jgi:hypothetical protein
MTLLVVVLQVQAQTEDDMKAILAEYDRDASLLCNKNAKANWNVQTDVLNTSLVAEQVS